MITLALTLAAGLAALPAAQQVAVDRVDRPVAVLMGLDKYSGRVTTFETRVGETTTYERLEVTVRACRSTSAEENAVAFLQIDDRTGRVFSGWMFAAEPSLSALDHPRYDVWLASCSTAETGAS